MKKSKIYFENLDSIRFVASLMVFLQHGISNSYQYLNIKNTFLEKLLNVISDGGTGVSIFFVLSGFLITYLLISEHELVGKINIKNFYIRRMLRIWPLYFAVIIFTFFSYPFLKSLIGISTNLGYNIFYHLSFLSNFDVIHIDRFCPGKDAMSQGITWSVSIEEQFYLFWPIIFTFLPKRVWLYAIGLIIFGSLLFRVINCRNTTILYFHTFSVLVDLGIGGLFAYLIKESDAVKRFFMNTSTTKHFIFLGLSVCLLLLSSSLYQFKYGYALARILFSTSFAFIISGQALTTSKSILNAKNLSFANRWGKYTYGIYLLHPIALTVIMDFAKIVRLRQDNFISLFCIGVFSFMLTLLLSKLSYEHFESKFLKLKSRFEIIKTKNNQRRNSFETFSFVDVDHSSNENKNHSR